MFDYQSHVARCLSNAAKATQPLRKQYWMASAAYWRARTNGEYGFAEFDAVRVATHYKQAI